MSYFQDVLQKDVGLFYHRDYSFLSWYAFLSNVPFSLCQLLSRYSRGYDDVHLIIPMLKNDFLQSVNSLPETILNDFPRQNQIALTSHLAEVFELLAMWSLNEYESDDEKPCPFYDASENGQIAFQNSAYHLLRSNSVLDSVLTDNEIYTVLKHEALNYNSNQIEMDFSRRKAS